MASNRFGSSLLLRLLLLSAGTAAYVYAFERFGLHAFSVVLLLAVTVVVYELWLFVQRTNREVTRFFASARHADFNQHFDFGELGCDFPALGETFNDILARLKEQRLSQEVELRQLRAMVDHMPVPLLALHQQGRVQLLNNAARRFFGRNRITQLHDLKQFGADFHGQVLTCRAGESRLARISIDGNESQVLILLTALSSDGGALQLVSLQDIGQELALAQLDAWQDLVRVLTHEIMNSITPVASLAQTTAEMADELAAAAPPEHPHRVPLAKINDAAGTVARRAGNLMQFVANYRQLTGLPAPQKRRLLAQEVLTHIARVATADAGASSPALSVDVSPPRLEFHADPEQVEQVMINLLRNAGQALTGKQDGRIALSAFLNPRGRVTLEVRDNGPGIDDKILPRIFMPYFTTKPDGSGIGLALARQIMMAHGGSIRASNAESGGAVFTLTF
jgi:two-component system, NtrC family, nitrogen regulation sensor histidine kinase NtrY